MLVDFKKAFDSIWHEGLLYKLMESGVGGKTYDIIKSMYTNNKCAVKIGKKHKHFFTQGRGVRQGCSLSPTLFNIYINELARALENSAAPGIKESLKEFENKSNFEKLPYLLGEIPQCAITAARFVTCCHEKRATSEEQTPL